MVVAKDVPYVPSSDERLQTMIELSQVSPGQKTVDLGSGDGRVVIAMAQLGAQAYGFEIDPDLVKQSLENIKKANINGNAFIVCTSYWNEPVDSFDIVMIYGITGIMERLEGKLKKELKPGAKVISNFFTFPNWEPVIRQNDVYVYQQPLI